MVMGAVVAGCLAGAALATEVEVATDFASAYVFRGATVNDGWVIQPSLELSGLKSGETDVPLTLGLWANWDLDDADGAFEEYAFSEIDLLLNLELPSFHERVAFSLGYAVYLYPGQETEVEADSGDLPEALPADGEISLACDIDYPLFKPAMTLNYGVDGGIEKNLYADFGIGHDFELGGDVTLLLEGKVGYAIPDEGPDGFNDLLLSVGLAWKGMTASVRYVSALDDEVLPDVADGGAYDVKVIGLISLAQSF